MAVVNCKVAYIRPQYNNLEEWMAEPNNVYIGRKGVVFIKGSRYPPQDSPFANKYKIGKDGSREEVIEKYRQYICGRLMADNDFYRKFLALRGKILGCWCVPEQCHGHVILELLNKADAISQE